MRIFHSYRLLLSFTHVFYLSFLCCRSQAKASIGFTYDNSTGVGNSDRDDDDSDSDSDSVLSDIGKWLCMSCEFSSHFLIIGK